MIKETNYINIYYWMIKNLNLEDNELIVYALIYNYSRKIDQWIEFDVDELVCWCKSSKREVRASLKSLLAKNLIEKDDYVDKDANFFRVKINLCRLQNLL